MRGEGAPWRVVAVAAFFGGWVAGAIAGAMLAQNGRTGCGVACALGVGIGTSLYAATLWLFVGIHDGVEDIREELAGIAREPRRKPRQGSEPSWPGPPESPSAWERTAKR